jgi:outer membrane protein OmpA-like peptidoglycan-associated protein
VLPERVRLRVVAVLPGGFTPENRKNLESLIRARTELPAQVLVYDVATREELTALTGRLTSPTPAPIETIEEIRAKLMTRVRSAMTAAWPTEQAPLLGYRVAFDPSTSAPRLYIAYLGTEDLAGLGEAALRKSLGERLGVATVEVQMERVQPEWQLAFAPARDSLSPAGQEALDAVAGFLARFPGARCRIMPPAEEGKEPTELSGRRAENVRKYLVEGKKVAPERIEVTPGKLQAADGRDARNRMAVQLLPPGQLP